MVNIIKNKIKKLIYKIYRKAFINNFIFKIGTIVEEEDKIICYAKQRLVDKKAKKVFYELYCRGFVPASEEIEQIVKKLKLDKPVYYVFDGINFNKAVKISAMPCNIIFKNCTFSSLGIGIICASNVTFENNKYLNWTDFYAYGDSFLYGDINELTIKNDQFVNSNPTKKYGINKFGINVSVNKLNIIDSNIVAESNGKIDIEAKETTIINSTISAPEIYIESESINDDNCKIIASKGIIIENKNEDFSCLDVEAPIFVYNNEDMSLLSKNKISLHGKNHLDEYSFRLKLVDSLKNLRDLCNEIIEEKTTEMRKSLERKSVKMITKK